MAKFYLLKWLGLGGFVLGFDQLTKWWVQNVLLLGERIEIFPWFSWVRWHNEGAAFSLLNSAGGWQRWFFVVLAIVFVGFILVELWRMPVRDRWMGWAYGLILGGALGNFFDRLMNNNGYVVDFVLVHYEDYYFPAFNLADSALFMGAALWIWRMVAESRQRRSGHEFEHTEK